MLRFLISLIRSAALVALCVAISPIGSVAAPATVSDPDNAHVAEVVSHARLLYAQAHLFKLTKREPEAQRIYGEIATTFESTQLSPVLLAVTGDHLLSNGEREKAAKFYADLREELSEEQLPIIDYACVRLGELALAEGRFQEELNLFTHAADEIAGAK